jgi:hypothetical protein
MGADELRAAAQSSPSRGPARSTRRLRTYVRGDLEAQTLPVTGAGPAQGFLARQGTARPSRLRNEPLQCVYADPPLPFEPPLQPVRSHARHWFVALLYTRVIGPPIPTETCRDGTGGEGREADEQSAQQPQLTAVLDRGNLLRLMALGSCDFQPPVSVTGCCSTCPLGGCRTGGFSCPVS